MNRLVIKTKSTTRKCPFSVSPLHWRQPTGVPCKRRQLCCDVVPPPLANSLFPQYSEFFSCLMRFWCCFVFVNMGLFFFSNRLLNAFDSQWGSPSKRNLSSPFPFLCSVRMKSLPGDRVPAVNMAEELLETVDRLQSRLLENPEPRKVSTEQVEAGRLGV